MDNNSFNKNQNTYSGQTYGFKGLVSLLVLTSLLALSACGGGAESQSRPAPPKDDEAPIYKGSLQSDDIKAFKKELWEKISPSSVCGRCHRSDADPANRKSPYFVDWQDVNLAYNEVVDRPQPLVDLKNPANSILVKRVEGGHQCWLGSSSLCAAKMTEYIQAWADSSKKGTTLVEFQLTPPSSIRPPGGSIFFPAATPSYYAGSTLYTLVSTHCSGCHRSSASSAQSPFFADTDIDTSYQAVKQVVNLNEPLTDSRVYQRLVAKHNCWSTCISPTGDSGDAIDMLNAIKQFIADGTLKAEPYLTDTQAVSMALQMQEGNVAASHNRYESDQIALYEFKSGSKDPDSNIIYDTSGVEPAMNLTLLDTKHRWLGNWGIEFTNSRGAAASVEDSRKLYNLIRLTGEYTVEAWVIPANVNQENATFIAYSGSATERNFALGQTMYNYDFYQRSSTLSAAGEPKLMTDPDDEDLQATLQHVVMTYSREAGRRIYVNGVFTGDVDPEEKGDLLNWHSSYALSFGNELSNNRRWDGILRLVAVHDRALTLEQIQQNYLAEVGQKFQVPFSVSNIIGDSVTDSYVVFEVSQFDEYSYLFRNPRFININPDMPDYKPTFSIRGMRIGMNNQIVTVGQAYNNINIEDVSVGYTAETGKILSTVDTVLQVQNGASGISADEFFLVFDDFAGKHYTFEETDQTVRPLLPTITPENKPSDIGMRTFDEINSSMAIMTGILDWPTVSKINDVFSTYRTQLPTSENIESFQGSHQMAVAQLAMTYCDELVNRETAVIPPPVSYFPGFVFGRADSVFSTPADRALVINPLLANMLNATDFLSDDVVDVPAPPYRAKNLATQPSVEEVRYELTWLMVGDSASRVGMAASGCTSEASCIERTKQIVKATCAAALGSAAMLIQ